MVEIVGVLVAARDGEHAGAQDVGDAVRHEQRIASVGDQPRQSLGNPQAALGGGQQHHAAVRGHPPAVEGSGEFLAADGWKIERQEHIVGHGGCGSA